MEAVEGAPPPMSLQVLPDRRASDRMGVQPAKLAGPPTKASVSLVDTAVSSPQQAPVETPSPKPVSFEPSHFATRLNDSVPDVLNSPPTSVLFVPETGVSARISSLNPEASCDHAVP